LFYYHSLLPVLLKYRLTGLLYSCNDVKRAYSKSQIRCKKSYSKTQLISLRLDYQRKFLLCISRIFSWWNIICCMSHLEDILLSIRIITKLPNAEQSYKGKVKTHKYINRQNQSTTGKLWKLLLKSLYSDTKILSKYIPSLQRR
jgi:hypothetical protein